jgi:hypothetical protein
MQRRNTRSTTALWALATTASLALTTTACSDEVLDLNAAGGAAQAIINGTPCTETEEPTAVAIMVDASIDFGQGEPFEINQAICTGTLIAPDVVLSAAHCLDLTSLTFGFGEVQRADFYVSFEADLSRFAAEQSLPVPESAIPTAGHVVHDGFDIQSLGQGTAGVEDDVALIFLAAPVDTVVPEVVISAAEGEQLAVGTAVTIAGWGQQVATSSPLDQPPAGSVGVKVCGSSTLTELGEALLQVGDGPETTRKCHGDSGGPTFTELTTQTAIKRRVIGVTSRAYDESDCAKGGVDTRVDFYVSWIDEQMKTACSDGTRTWCDVQGILSADDVVALGNGDDDAHGGNDDDDDEGAGDDSTEDDTDVGLIPGCGAQPPSFWGALVGWLVWRRRRGLRGL